MSTVLRAAAPICIATRKVVSTPAGVSKAWTADRRLTDGAVMWMMAICVMRRFLGADGAVAPVNPVVNPACG